MDDSDPYLDVAVIYSEFFCDRCHTDYFDAEISADELAKRAKDAGWVVKYEAPENPVLSGGSYETFCPKCSRIKYELTNEIILENVLEISLGPFPIVMGKLAEDQHPSLVRYEGASLCRRVNAEGDVRWAIQKGSLCMNKDGDFEYESMPSSRTEDFFERCRFDSMEEAYDFYQKWKAWVVEKFHKGTVWGTNTWDDEMFKEEK